ncbi:MAG: phage integrase N-terminal domain-containing protein [Cellvibrionaceae bacterium]
MGKLWFELKDLCKREREGSHTTQSKRYRELRLIAKTLERLGYRHMTMHSLKPKHIDALVNHWKSQELSVATIKKRLSYLRWWSRKVNRKSVIASNNRYYGLE